MNTSTLKAFLTDLKRAGDLTDEEAMRAYHALAAKKLLRVRPRTGELRVVGCHPLERGVVRMVADVGPSDTP